MEQREQQRRSDLSQHKQQEQHDKILKMSMQIDQICTILKGLPCEANTETLTRHDEKIKALWLPFAASISAAIGVVVMFVKDGFK